MCLRSSCPWVPPCTWTVPHGDPLPAYIKVKTENIGYGELYKKDEASGVNLAGAVKDYDKALKYDPENRNLWHNRVLCHIQQKEYDVALAQIDTMLTL